MIFGIPASASEINLREEGAVDSLLSYCDEVGVDHVSVAPPVRDNRPDTDALIKLRNQLSDAGLTVYAGGIFYAREGDFYDETVRNEQRRQLIELIRCYGKAGVEPITVFCRVDPSQNSDEQGMRWNLATEFLSALVDEAEAVKARLAVHTLGNSVFNRYETVMRMFSDIPSDFLGVCYDVAIHTQLEDDISGNIKALKEKMPLIHVRTIGDVTPWRDFEISDGKLQKAAPREIQVDFLSMMRTLVEIEYDGIVSLEHQRGAIAYARAVGYLKGVLEGVS